MSEGLQKRLQRLLFLIPYVGRHQTDGLPLSQAIEAAGYGDVAELEADLPLLELLGPPDGSPHEFVDLYVEDDRIIAYVPAPFTKPPRLSVIEGVALLSAAKLLLSEREGALAQAISRLRRGLPIESEKEFSELERAMALQVPPQSQWHAALERAIAQRVEVTLEYFSPVRGSVEPRRVEPRTLFARLGNWYLEATTEGGQLKKYRLDRIQGLEVGERHFEGDEAADATRYEGTVLFEAVTSAEVVLRFDRGLARLARERWGDQAHDEPNGAVTVVMRMASEAYAVSWVLGFGGAVRIVSPQQWQESVERKAREILARHQGEPAA